MIFLTFFIGVIVNFIGYIPPGNVNLTVVKITINRNIKEALRFITAFSIAEFIFIYGVMHGAEWLSEQLQLEFVIDMVMIVLFLTMGTITLVNRNKPPKTKYSARESISYGLLLGFINPMQIPYWMVVGTYLLAHKWITSTNLNFLSLSAGAAAGSFLCLLLFSRFARYIQDKFEISNRALNIGIAVLFFCFAGYQIVKHLL